MQGRSSKRAPPAAAKAAAKKVATARPAVSRKQDRARPRVRRGDGRQRILRGALDLFANLGFDSVSTADIAKQAGTSQSVVLYHFTTKEELWREAMRLLFSEVDARRSFDRAAYKDLDTLSRLRVLLRGFVLTSARHPELGRVIFREGASGGERLTWLMKELAGPNYAFFEALFKDGAQHKILKDYPSLLLTIMVHGAAATVFNLAPLSRQLLDEDPFSAEMIEKQADMVVDVLLHGLMATP